MLGLRSRRCIAFVAIAFCLSGARSSAVGASAPAPPPIAGSIGVRLVDAPAAAGADPRAQIYIVDRLAPGSVTTRRMEVSNGTAAVAQIALYSSAGEIINGSFVGAAQNTANDLSSWTTVSPNIADVAAGGASIASVTIAVPADAAPGERYGVVWAEVRSDPGTSGITQVTRVGIRLYVSVGPGAPPAPDFSIDSLTPTRSSQGVPSIVAEVHNTGGRALDMSGTAMLAGGPGGLNAGPFPVALGVTLAIGATEPLNIALDKAIPAGPWQVTITLHSGLVERTAKATLTFPEIGAAPAVPIVSLGAEGTPTAALVVALAVGAVAVSGGAVHVRRRRRRSVT